jgi:hypothetical protein
MISVGFMADASKAPFSVIHFALETSGASPTQRSAKCGAFDSVEDAFENARALAAEKVGLLRHSAAGEEASLLDTEWGYDIRLGPLTVHRFWVHEHFSTQRTLA